MARRFMALASTRRAKSDERFEGSTLLALVHHVLHGTGTDILQRGQRIDNRPVFHAKFNTALWFTDGGTMGIFRRCASCLNSISLSVLPRSRVIDAARNSTG